MPFIGQQPTTGTFVELDSLTASATADYTLQLNGANYEPESVNNLLVSINGVIQGSSTMSLSGSTLTVGATLSSSDVIDFVRVFGNVGTISTPTDGSVTTNKIGTGAVTTAKIADNAVSSAKISASLGKVLQAVSATPVTADQAGTTNGSWKYGGIQVAITPSSTSSKIFVIVNGNPYFASGGDFAVSIHRNITSGTSENTVITGGTNLGHADKGLGVFQDTSGNHRLPISLHILDSPNSTAQQTYSYSIRTYSANNHTGLSGGMTAQMTAFEIGA